MTEKANKKPKGKASPLSLFTTLLLLMMIGFFLTSMAMIVLIGMVPTIVAVITDRDNDKCLSTCVFLCNLCGVIPFIVVNFKSGITMSSGLYILENPINLMIMLASAALGWGIYIIVPQITIMLARNRDYVKLHQLRQRFFDLREDWGDALPDSPLINNCKTLHSSVPEEADSPKSPELARR